MAITPAARTTTSRVAMRAMATIADGTARFRAAKTIAAVKVEARVKPAISA